MMEWRRGRTARRFNSAVRAVPYSTSRYICQRADTVNVRGAPGMMCESALP